MCKSKNPSAIELRNERRYFAEGKVVVQEVVPENERLTRANPGSASVWIPWYFKRGALMAITAPLAVSLAYCLTISIAGAAVQAWALLRASHAVFGLIGAFLAACVGLIPVIMPPVLYYSLVKNLPGLWIRQDAARHAKLLGSLAVLILLPLSAYLIYHAVGLGIAWIADRDPCAALSAGVSGSRLPVNCR